MPERDVDIMKVANGYIVRTPYDMVNDCRSGQSYVFETLDALVDHLKTMFEPAAPVPPCNSCGAPFNTAAGGYKHTARCMAGKPCAACGQTVPN